MKEVTAYLRKKILVLGLAKSGVSAASLLHKLGAFVTVNDKRPVSENPEAQELVEQGIKVICGDHPIELLDEGFELIVKNPGIPYSIPLVKGAMERGIPVITEVELAYQISEAPFIGITGTNGKTTTTTIIYEILREGNKNPLIAGNIGTVASGVAEKASKDDTIVIELSSFQLMGINEFRPRIAILTNIYDAHLDYHGTKKEYMQAKAAIGKAQTEDDYFIFNADQEEVIGLARQSKAIQVPFSTQRVMLDGAYIEDGYMCFRGEKIIELSKVALPGKHNQENILAAIAASKLSGVSNEAIESILTAFTGVKHRLQFVKEINRRRFYNDSKATNILSAAAALRSFNGPTILLAGGLDRGNEFDELIPALQNVKALVTFGETAPKIERAAREAGISIIKRVHNVVDAVPAAYSFSEEGDTILLSPACASWDQYKTFEVRGDMFMEAVHKLK
ncbi:UDP-N-acetylmuramoyl-L-alanine--D-glutamate ligase [Peribacillus kribbensis]|uniref:UDP-N-acetylmuramoyl-L-alanine--D-glutamate ligase n=1 Tax=Peribacillus kribbensis TaxID=356658 RepID=UPI0004130198|nr:UDP-N-acetylmuramoyl-L-alanine--D-glutamate ligase [Peribacillus kribbensis]